MQIHFEASQSVAHEGVIDLDEDEAAEWRELTTSDEKRDWLQAHVFDAVNDGDHERFSDIDDGWFATVRED